MGMKILILIIAVLVSGCGSENHSYGWEYDYNYKEMRVRGDSELTPNEIYAQYEKAVSCFGDKHPPFIIFVPEVINGEACGRTKINPPLILISTNKACLNNNSLPHENVHYFGFRGHNQKFKNALQCVLETYIKPDSNNS